jgi:hypothetical protein
MKNKPKPKAPIFKIVEKKNPLAVHAHCSCKEGAERWIKEKAPIYCANGYFMDKTLTPDSFIIKED